METDLERIRALVDQLAVRQHGVIGIAHVLVVEDEPNDIDMMVRVLEKLPCKTSIATDGSEAVIRLMDNSINLVFLDLNLPRPGPNGMDILRKIRQERPELTVVVMSGGDLSHIQDAIEFGPLIVAKKPVPSAQIEQVISSVIAHKKVNEA